MRDLRVNKNSAFVIIALFIIAFFSWISLSTLPKALDENAPTEKFSAQRAFNYVKRMTQSPRRLGSAAHETSKNFLMNQVSKLGCELSIQKTYSATSFRQGVFAGPVENILCLFKGESENSVLVMSHYDSVHMSPGAGDAASGVSIALESARALSTAKHKNSLLLLFSDGEESGLLGAAAFVKSELYKKYKVKTLINFEARGTSGPFALFETHNFNDINSQASKQIPQPIGNSFMDFLYQFLPNETDMSIFKSLDISAMNFAFARGLEHYHTSSDSAENLSLQSLQHAGDSALHTIGYLLNTPLDDMNSRPKVLYQDLFGKIHLSYSPLLIKITSAIIFLFLLIYLIRAKPNLIALCLSYFFSLAIIACALIATRLSHSILWSIWGSSAVIIDFYFFFLAFALSVLIAFNFLFLRLKKRYPSFHHALILCLMSLIAISFFSVEFGSLIVWSSFGLCLLCGWKNKITQVIALIPIAVFLPEFLHSSLIADSGTQFVLPAFILIFFAILLNIYLGITQKDTLTAPTHKVIKRIHSLSAAFGLALFAFLGIKYGLLESKIKRAEFFEILSDDKLYVSLSKSLKIETFFKQKVDKFRKDILLSPLTRWKIRPSEFDLFETDATLPRSPTTLFTQWGTLGEPYKYILDVPTQDYECVHIIFASESPIFDLKINGQSPYLVPRKKFAPTASTSPGFIESCSLKNIPLRLEFKSSPANAAISEIWGIFTQNSKAPTELGLDPQSTIMSFFSNTLYVLKKITL